MSLARRAYRSIDTSETPRVRAFFKPRLKLRLKQVVVRPWLGRQDSNLGMAESKSDYFACFVNAYSEKSSTFD
jgi:hypothetical protein